MSLAVGSRLGAYEVLGPLGAGGMGEVYRAKDARLHREVAVKVLPEEFFESEERRARFEREARMLASLNHPGIAHLYSFEEIPSSSSSRSRHILVMELVAGETLRERMKSGGLSPRQTLEIGAQIARGLAAAHEKGIVHRDLKPENVVVSKDGRVKILDFGLAKLSPQAKPGDELTSAGTRSLLTEAGAVFGTVGYMSPEQVRGEPVDGRSDIFALGTLLYELLSGRNPFRAATSAETMTAILRSEPPALVVEDVPPALSAVVARCLEKQPEKRFQSAEDLAFALENSSGSSRAAVVPAGAEARPKHRGRGVLAAACAAGLVLGALGMFVLRRTVPAAPARPVRFTIQPPENGAFVNPVEWPGIAFSPDGSQLAYVAWDPKGGRRILLRTLSGFEARTLAGTEGALSVFWSPDGQSLGFFAGNKLKRLELAGGAPVSICEVAGGGGKSGTWGHGDILYASIQGDAIYRVPASGGAPSVVLKPDKSAGETRIVWPWFLPDGERFLYYVRVEGGGKVMMAEPGKPPRPVLQAASMAQYTDPGYLVFVKEGSLFAQRFDAKSGATSGVPFSIAERVRYFMSTGTGTFATSRGGSLAYEPQDDTHRLVWFDRSGRETGTIGAPAKINSVRISRERRPILFDRAQGDLGTFDVWSFDAERSVETRITSSPESEFSPLWLPGGKSLLYSVVRGANPRLVRRDLATGQEEVVLPESGFQVAGDISPDGKHLVYFERTGKGAFDLWEVGLEGGGAPRRLADGTYLSSNTRFSPDGRFLAITSRESGQPEVYLMPFPGPGEKTRVSTRGATSPRWSPDGRELFYLSGDMDIVSVPVRTSPSLELGIPKPLFRIKGRSPWQGLEVSADGTRFLAIVPETIADEQPIHVVVNWPAAAGK